MLYYVINARRPLQQTADEVVEMMEQISTRIRLQVDGLIEQYESWQGNDGRRTCLRTGDMPGSQRANGRAGFVCFRHAGYPLRIVVWRERRKIPLTIYTFPDWLVDGEDEK